MSEAISTLEKIRSEDTHTIVYLTTPFHPDNLQDLHALAAQGMRFELLNKPVTRDQLEMVLEGVLGISAELVH
jgi:hypothetical protein